MTHSRFFNGALLAVVLLQSAIVAQPPKRHETGEKRPSSRKQFPRDSFFEAVGQASRENADREMLELMFREEVRKHLEMSEEQTSEFRDVMRKTFSGLRELRDKYRADPNSLEALRDEIKSLVANNSKEAIDYLREAEKLDGLTRVYVQLHGASAASSGQVASRIGLAGKELDDFRTKKSEVWRRLMSKVSAEMEQLIQNRSSGRHERMGQLYRIATKQLREELKEDLTLDQGAKLNTLRGEDIPGIQKWLERPMPGPGRSGGGRRPPPNSDRSPPDSDRHSPNLGRPGKDSPKGEPGCC